MTAVKQLFISGPAGQLEALYTPAEIASEVSKPSVLLCHPHPLHGGTMHTKLIYWLGKLFHDQGYATLKFNFRGVGLSEGEWDDGKGEADDVFAAMQWLKQRQSSIKSIWVAAFSFGCYAGLKAMHREADVKQFFAVAPAVNLYDFSFLKKDQRPIYVTQGTADEIVPYQAVKEWCQTMPTAQLTTIPNAGHFFAQQKKEMETVILQQIQQASLSL